MSISEVLAKTKEFSIIDAINEYYRNNLESLREDLILSSKSYDNRIISMTFHEKENVCVIEYKGNV